MRANHRYSLDVIKNGCHQNSSSLLLSASPFNKQKSTIQVTKTKWTQEKTFDVCAYVEMFEIYLGSVILHSAVWFFDV